MTDLDSWLSYIAERHTQEVKLGLERIQHLAETLQLRHFPCPVISVAGTNGKGTTVAAITQLYTAAGYRVGSYYSPHLHHFTERVMLNNKPVSESELCAAFATIAQNTAEKPLTFFEFITLAALVIFKSHPLDLLVLEVGLGGRLDATNCVENDAAIITQIAFDHCERLGYDRESIGFEKAGIFRKNKIAICAEPDPPKSLLDQAESLDCDFYCIGKEYFYEGHDQEWSWRTEGVELNHLPLPKIPMSSAAAALMLSYCFSEQLSLKDEDRLQAIENTQLPGRFEVIQDCCPIIFDVAHNEASALLLAEKIKQTGHKGKTYAVFSVLADKDCGAIVRAMAKLIDEWHVLPLQCPRAEKTEKIVHQIKALFDQPCYNHVDLSSMWNTLREKLHPQDRVVVFGSFYTVAAVQSELRKTV